MKQIITIQHTQSIHHTNGMVGSWTDWDLSELGIEQAERIGQKLAKQLSGHKIVMYASDLSASKSTPLKLSQSIWESHLTLERNFESAI
ncbi:MAG: phosphoglycerate mutase family protein [Subdoligranulum sp.]